MLIRTRLLALALSSLVPVAILAQDSGDGDGANTSTVLASASAAVDRIMAPWHSDRTAGGVVAVVRGGEIIFARGYGMANLEYGIRNGPSTVFHVASVSKQFTAFAIVMLAQEGVLSLDDDVRQHIAELPDFGQRITLRHLLTHTSGLRDQWTLWTMSGGRMDDVIRQGDLLRLIERQRELNFAPGSEYLYSNSGYLLLAEVVARKTEQPFGEWMRERVFEPLGMRSTQVYDDHEVMVPGRAYSYTDGASGTRKAILSYANSGATSLLTTAEDLARWLRNFHTAEIGGAASLASMQERGILTRGDTLPYALGIGVGVHRGLRRIQHSGADAGFRTMLAYYPELDAGVIVLGNVASLNAGEIATEVAEVFFGDRMAARPAASRRTEEVRRVSVRVLEGYVGTYAMENGPLVQVIRSDEQLLVQVEGERAIPLLGLSDTLFLLDAPGGRQTRLAFHRERGGQARAATLYGATATFLRRIEPWNPGLAELAAYAGRYYSPELETFYTIELREGALVLRHRRHGDFVVTPRSPDVFRANAWFLGSMTFERNTSGSVTGMRLSNARVRNLAFVRVDGR